MMAWRSHPKLYQNFYIQDEPLDWEGHVNWWNSRGNRRDWIIVVNTDGRWRDVGIIALFNLDEWYPEVNTWVGEVTFWGNGVATEAVQFALDWLDSHNFSGATAKIFNKNKASQSVFKKVGFQRVGDARENESEYRIEL